MTATPSLLMRQVLRLLRPVVRLLVRQGVHYPAFTLALKPLFLDAAQAELARLDKPATDSAVSLMSGVHRRDVRELTRLGGSRARYAADAPQSLSFSNEVVARWMASESLAPGGQPRVLPRHGEADSFDALIASISRDVRPRAVLDEMLRLGVAEETEAGIALTSAGFVPRQGFEDMAAALADNLHDHAAAAAANLQGDANFLEQAVYVDQITDASVAELQTAARAAWQDAFKAVMAKAQERFDHDAQHAPAEARHQRARFGVYFYNEPEPPAAPPSPEPSP